MRRRPACASCCSPVRSHPAGHAGPGSLHAQLGWQRGSLQPRPVRAAGARRGHLDGRSNRRRQGGADVATTTIHLTGGLGAATRELDPARCRRGRARKAIALSELPRWLPEPPDTSLAAALRLAGVAAAFVPASNCLLRRRGHGLADLAQRGQLDPGSYLTYPRSRRLQTRSATASRATPGRGSRCRRRQGNGSHGSRPSCSASAWRRQTRRPALRARRDLRSKRFRAAGATTCANTCRPTVVLGRGAADIRVYNRYCENEPPVHGWLRPRQRQPALRHEDSVAAVISAWSANACGSVSPDCRSRRRRHVTNCVGPTSTAPLRRGRQPHLRCGGSG